MTKQEFAENNRGSVPCSGCTLCCKGDAIRLLPSDDAGRYLTEPHPYLSGALMLAHKPNLDSIYLSEIGCTIHEYRPLQCREMDCRLLASKISYTQARKLSKCNKLKLPVWQKGKELLRAAP
jgi:Fe-S-cluster containining protein